MMARQKLLNLSSVHRQTCSRKVYTNARSTRPLGDNPQGTSCQYYLNEHKRGPSLHLGILVDHLCSNPSIPGISSFAKNLRVAPPPVETWLTSVSVTPARFIASNVSPPPIRVFEPRQKAKAILLAIFIVPLENAPISNNPMGPFQKIVPDPLPPISSENLCTVSSPISNPAIPSGISVFALVVNLSLFEDATKWSVGRTIFESNSDNAFVTQDK